MKKFFIGLSAIILVIIFAPKTNAQQMKVGGAIGYASEIETVGFSADFVYQVNEKWEAAVNLTYFSEEYVNWTAFDVNAHYLFAELESVTVYGIGGFEYLHSKFDIPAFKSPSNNFNSTDYYGSSESTDGSFGVNLGLGGRLALSDKLDLFGEGKYVVLDHGYANFRVGLTFNL